MPAHEYGAAHVGGPASETLHRSRPNEPILVCWPRAFRLTLSRYQLGSPDLRRPSRKYSACVADLKTARGRAVPVIVKEGCRARRALACFCPAPTSPKWPYAAASQYWNMARLGLRATASRNNASASVRRPSVQWATPSQPTAEVG